LLAVATWPLEPTVSEVVEPPGNTNGDDNVTMPSVSSPRPRLRALADGARNGVPAFGNTP
jgi:hypothetical protein